MIVIPRSPRQKSNTNVYHIIVRGINRQDIFLDKQDYRKFLKEIKRTKETYKYELYAYILMPNHIHLVINDMNNNLSTFMQSLNISYTYYFNKKYERVGHLFENRFKSKIVEEESYLKNVVRYVHKNPENAGMQELYFWSSYREYLSNKQNLIDKQFIMDLFQNNIENFKRFHKDYIKNQDIDKDYEMITKMEDEEAIKIMKELSKEENLMKIQKYDKDRKREIIEKFIKIEGIKKVQIARILGINKRTIERMRIK